MLAFLMTVVLAANEPDERSFVVAQLEFVHAARPQLYRFEQVLGPRQARLVRALGCGRYECRETAREALEFEGLSALPAAYWGSQSRDAEIAARCRVLLTRLAKCRHCAGSGQCYARDTNPGCRTCQGSHWSGVFPVCLACNGTGDSRRAVQDAAPSGWPEPQ